MINFLFFIAGSFIGSFLNVCIYRIPKEKSIISPGSSCPHCAYKIKWHENIPLLSFLFLRGKCSGCGKRISGRYFVVELLTALVFVLLYSKVGPGLNLLFFLIFSCALIVITFIDFEYQMIPDSVSLGTLAVGLLASVISPSLHGEILRKHSLISSALGIAAGAGSIYLMGVFGKAVFKKEAVGFGDVQLLAMIGAFLGWQKTILVFFMAPFFGAPIGIAKKLVSKQDTIPYAPYLSLAAFVAMLWGRDIIAKILHLY
ncbi:MAG: prepilin peptidase [Candidatus Omnitrophota bacterium]